MNQNKNKTKSYSVNLTVEEWELIKEQLHQARVTDYPVDQGFVGYDDEETKHFKHLFKLSNRVTKKIENKETLVQTETQKLKHQNKLLEESNVFNRKRQNELQFEKVAVMDELELNRLETVKLKNQLDEQHKDLTDIKKKIKSITDLLNK